MNRKATIEVPSNCAQSLTPTRYLLGVELGSVLADWKLSGVVSLLPAQTPASFCGIARGIDTNLPVEKDRF
jgi:hypothetical protein